MAAVVTPVDQASGFLQKLSLDSDSKPFEVSDNAKKYSSVNSGVLANGLNKPFERSVTPFMDPTLFYPSGYPSTFYYGVNDWGDYRYPNNEGVEVPHGAYGNNGSLVYPQEYGYAPFGTYHPPTSPVPTMVHDGQLYGPQHYQYPSYYPSSVPSSGSYAHPPSQANVPHAGDQASLPVDAAKVNGNLVNAGGCHGINAPKPLRPNYQNSTWRDAPVYPDGKSKHAPVSHGNNFFNSGRNQSLHSYSHLTQPRPTPGMNMNQTGFMDRMYPNNRLYGQYANMLRSGTQYGISSYDRNRFNAARGWMGIDSRYNKPRGRSNGYFAHDNNVHDGLNELNRGPRAKGFKNNKDVEPVTIALKGGQNIQLNTVVNNEENKSDLDLGQYNKEDFSEVYKDARFFIIKSYSEDDVHKSIKYGVWASTPNGNKKLDGAYREAQEVASGCPIFLFFSVNASGQFIGVAEMGSGVDFEKSVEYWQQDKWMGCFPVRWHIVKDIPNSLLKHITLANNEDKPVTNSRDTQEVKLEQGIEMLKIFKGHSSKTCILDDFGFYEARERIIQEKKAKQQLFNKRVASVKLSEVAAADDKDTIETNVLEKPLDVSAAAGGPVLVEEPLVVNEALEDLKTKEVIPKPASSSSSSS